jgi:hypothetical protein
VWRAKTDAARVELSGLELLRCEPGGELHAQALAELPLKLRRMPGMPWKSWARKRARMLAANMRTLATAATSASTQPVLAVRSADRYGQRHRHLGRCW